MMKIEKKLMKIDESVIKDSGQLLIVLTKDWQAFQGQIQRMERDTDEDWKEVGEAWKIVVGRNGLAWGKGLHSIEEEQAFQKKEGDGKSPAGVFALAEAFGFAPTAEAEWVKLPYVRITEKWECVDDADSRYYNHVVANDKVDRVDWDSSEKMLAVGEEYRWGIVVKHNMKPVQAGCGSCIFIHIWKDAETGTSGCTAMKRENMEALLRWIDAEKKPLLIQLPESEMGWLDEALGNAKE